MRRIKWRFLSIIMLCSSSVNSGTISTQLELGCQDNKARGNTVINPQRRLLNPSKHTCRFALNPFFYKAGEDYELQLNGLFQWTYDTNAPENSNKLNNAHIWQTSYFRWSPNSRISIDFGAAVIEQGPGYAWNPSNPFFDVRLNERDESLPTRREADPKAGLSYLTNNGQWSLSWVNYQAYPDVIGRRESSYVLSFDHFFNSSQLTINLATLAQRPFLGVGYSWTASPALEVYSEYSLREGRKVPLFTTLSLNDTNISFFEDEYDQSLYSNALLGFQYTFSSGINMISELYYQQDGYSNSAWNRLLDEIEVQNRLLNNDEELNTSSSAAFLLNSHNWLRLYRQAYFFSRVAFPDLIWQSELSVFGRLNIDDKSSIVGFFWKKEFENSFRVEFSGRTASGSQLTEGFWVPVKNQLAIAVRYSF